MRILKILIQLALFLPFLISCNFEKKDGVKRIVIGISADIETINPLYSFSVDEGVIDETLFLSLVNFEWDSSSGELLPQPMLANQWEWANDSGYVIFNLRNDVYWSDGKQFTAEDVAFTLALYSDPDTESRMTGAFKNFHTDKDGRLIPEKTFEIISPFRIKINFLRGSVPSLLDVTVPIIPKHIFDKINRSEIPKSSVNFNPVSSGPYKLKKWERNQMIVLEANKKSFLYRENMADEIIFKIVPDYNSRLIQLKKEEIDFCELIKPADAKDLEKEDNLVIETVIGREYDYIGWNNIDPGSYNEKKIIRPNNLFGSVKVRTALAYAINNREILSEYLNNYGQIAVSPVSSIFKIYFDSTLKSIEYNPDIAGKLLAEEGWFDRDNNGILEKQDSEFRFTLFIPGGNPLREYAATIIKNNLKTVGIEMNFEKLELGAFIENLYERKLDAWMASWFIQLPLELKTYWYSDLENTPLNFTAYQSNEADYIMDQLDGRLSTPERADYVKEFQRIIYKDQPVKFMYWTDNIVIHTKRLRNLTINPYGAMQKLWEWRSE